VTLITAVNFGVKLDTAVIQYLANLGANLMLHFRSKVIRFFTVKNIFVALQLSSLLNINITKFAADFIYVINQGILKGEVSMYH
jgi:hypothetical protein